MNDELYHHGVKGQRWGHRKQRYGDIRDTGGSRPKNTTGNSKGVHRRGEGLNTGPVGKRPSGSVSKSPFISKSTTTTITNSSGNSSGMAGYGMSREELEKEKRSAQYKDEAIALRLQNEDRIKNSKKFLSKLKLFGDAYTEVHSENIEKGVNFIKKLFKRK